MTTLVALALATATDAHAFDFPQPDRCMTGTFDGSCITNDYVEGLLPAGHSFADQSRCKDDAGAAVDGCLNVTVADDLDRVFTYQIVDTPCTPSRATGVLANQCYGGYTVVTRARVQARVDYLIDGYIATTEITWRAPADDGTWDVLLTLESQEIVTGWGDGSSDGYAGEVVLTAYDPNGVVVGGDHSLYSVAFGGSYDATCEGLGDLIDAGADMVGDLGALVCPEITYGAGIDLGAEANVEHDLGANCGQVADLFDSVGDFAEAANDLVCPTVMDDIFTDDGASTGDVDEPGAPYTLADVLVPTAPLGSGMECLEYTVEAEVDICTDLGDGHTECCAGTLVQGQNADCTEVAYVVEEDGPHVCYSFE